MADRVRLDHVGIAKLLKSSDMERAVRAKAEQVADAVRSRGYRVGGFGKGGGTMDLPVRVIYRETDRARAVVALAHPAGDAVQAKHGALTKAAAQAGLEVKSR